MATAGENEASNGDGQNRLRVIITTMGGRGKVTEGSFIHEASTFPASVPREDTAKLAIDARPSDGRSLTFWGYQPKP